MKKIYYIICLAVIALFTACQDDYNKTNFPGLIGTGVTNVAAYNYTLVDADYATIATAVKKPVNDSISTYKTLLKTASHADSIKLNASIARLNLKLTTDSTYIKASYIASNKILNSKLKGKDYLPYLFNQKYLYADNGSTIKVSYNNVDNGDTTAIPASGRFTLTDADYIQMGTAANQPGQYKELSATIPAAMTYLNTYLKIKCPYAVTGDTKVVSYLYYDSNKSAKKQYRILTFDGTNWGGVSEQYIFNGKEWIYDPTIYIKLVKGAPNNLYVMAFINYLIAHKDDATNPTHWYPKLTYVNEEHYYGFSAYYPEFIFTADRTTYGDAAIKALKTDAEKYVLFNQRIKEAMPLFTQINFPNLQTTVSGLQQYVVFSMPAYYSSSKTTTFTIKMKCTKSGITGSPAEYSVESIVEQ